MARITIDEAEGNKKIRRWHVEGMDTCRIRCKQLTQQAGLVIRQHYE